MLLKDAEGLVNSVDTLKLHSNEWGMGHDMKKPKRGINVQSDQSPCFALRKRYPFTAGLTERAFQSWYGKAQPQTCPLQPLSATSPSCSNTRSWRLSAILMKRLTTKFSPYGRKQPQ